MRPANVPNNCVQAAPVTPRYFYSLRFPARLTGMQRHNLFEVERNCWSTFPGLARCSQPWALLQNPFGIPCDAFQSLSDFADTHFNPKDPMCKFILEGEVLFGPKGAGCPGKRPEINAGRTLRPRPCSPYNETPLQGFISFSANEPRALPWAGMNDAFGVVLGLRAGLTGTCTWGQRDCATKPRARLRFIGVASRELAGGIRRAPRLGPGRGCGPK
jgi:hypothetical protein